MNQVRRQILAWIRPAMGLVTACALGQASAEPSPDPAAVGEETIFVVDRADRRPDGAAPTARDRDRALGEAPFVTVVHADERSGAASVAEAVGTTVGVRTRSLGGLGAYAAISVRGAAPGQTEVLIDGVPLSRIAAVTSDLGRFSLDAFSSVDLYRGAVPLELGGAGVGGALNMITRLGPGAAGERLRAALGVGSYGARHLRVRYGDDHLGGRLRSATTVGYTAATGDYTYFSDGGTPLNPSDDGFVTRANNASWQLDGASRLGDADGATAGGLRLAYKRQGLPGSSATPTQQAALGTFDVIADARGEATLGELRERHLGYGLVELQHLEDPLAELGLGAQDRRYRTLSGGAVSSWQRAIACHTVAAALESRGDHFRDEGGGAHPALIGARGAVAASLGATLNLAGGLVLSPAARLEVLRTAPTAMTAGPTAYQAPPPRWDVVPSPRVTLRRAFGDDVAIKGSVGWYARLPTLLELFGDRGFILGSPGLRAERGPAAELGVVWAPGRPLDLPVEIDRVLIEADAFATQASDTIALISSGGFVARATNVGDTRTAGGELAASARLARAVAVTASYTLLLTEQQSAEVSFAGKALPRQPRHALYGRIDASHRVAGRLLGAWTDASWQAESFLDQANLRAVPSRLLVGAGARVELGAGLALALEVGNALDVRIERLPLDPPPRPDLATIPTALADLAGYPLPGRTLYVSVEWLR